MIRNIGLVSQCLNVVGMNMILAQLCVLAAAVMGNCKYTLSLFLIVTLGAVTECRRNVTICSQCQCLNSKVFIVDCNNENLSEMPQLEKDLKVPWRLMISGNSLTQIHAFSSLENLTELIFKYNRISKIDDLTFYNLTNLEFIDLSHNNLSAESLNPKIFKGPYATKLQDPIPLKRLSLANNYLRRLPKDLFKHLSYLTSLDLSNNPFGDFSSTTAQAMSELQTLNKLDLSYTKLKRLPDHFFAELINLEELDLSGNDFMSVPSEINFAHSLKTLSINNNIFATITRDSFWGTMDNLQTLNLQESQTLFRIENGAFGNLTSLKVLRLSNNPQLSNIFPLAFMNKHNQSLDLRELHLENNNLEYLPSNALPWKEIMYLNIQGNPWKCDCNFEYFAKEVVPVIEDNNFDLSLKITCASPVELMGQKVTTSKVQNHEFVCVEYDVNVGQYGFVVVATIVVGTLLLVTGTIIFSYVLFRRTKVNDWIGENVKYRRTLNEEEDIISSNMQY